MTGMRCQKNRILGFSRNARINDFNGAFRTEFGVNIYNISFIVELQVIVITEAKPPFLGIEFKSVFIMKRNPIRMAGIKTEVFF